MPRDGWRCVSASRTILLVEDEDELRHLYRQVLLLAGYQVVEARSGYEALQRLETRVPDLVVLDLGLPGIDGKSVYRELAAQSSTRAVPVLIVTGNPQDAVDLRVACVMTKPVSAKQLLNGVTECLYGQA